MGKKTFKISNSKMPIRIRSITKRGFQSTDLNSTVKKFCSESINAYEKNLPYNAAAFRSASSTIRSACLLASDTIWVARRSASCSIFLAD